MLYTCVNVDRLLQHSQCLGGTHFQFQKQPVNEVSVYRMSEITILVFWMSIHNILGNRCF